MKDIDLFQMALNLPSPWKVVSNDFNPELKRLDLKLDFTKGSTFECPVCQASDCSPHDTKTKTWRHLNFFEHEAYLTARVPRIKCDKCGIRTIQVPWARKGSGFTLLFEAYVITLIPLMAVKSVADLVSIIMLMMPWKAAIYQR